MFGKRERPTEKLLSIPDFTTRTDLPKSTLIESNEVTVTADDAWVFTAMVRGADAELSINGGSWAKDAVFRNGDTIKLRATTSANALTETVINLYAQSLNKQWSITTTSGTSVWTPAELGASLALWLDADDASTITLNGSNVSQWDDKSGNDRHATQGTAAAQPLYVSGGINGINSVSFVENDGLLSPIVFSTANDATVICVLKYNSLLSSQSIYSTEDTGGVPAMYLQASAGTLRIYGGSYVDDGTYTVGQVEINAFSRGASTGNLWRDGSQVLTDAAIGTNTKNAGFLMGQLVNSLYGTFEMGEVVAMNGQASTADRQKIEGYLAHKWGLTANLPGDHPYKNTPPTV